MFLSLIHLFFTHAPFRILSNFFIPKMQVFNPMKRLKQFSFFFEVLLEMFIDEILIILKKNL